MYKNKSKQYILCDYYDNMINFLTLYTNSSTSKLVPELGDFSPLSLRKNPPQ